MSAQVTGFFWRISTQQSDKRVLCYRCARCKNFSMFPNRATEPVKAWCCNRWVTPEREGWLSKLPEEKYSGPMVYALRNSNNATDSEEAFA